VRGMTGMLARGIRKYNVRDLVNSTNVTISFNRGCRKKQMRPSWREDIAYVVKAIWNEGRPGFRPSIHFATDPQD